MTQPEPKAVWRERVRQERRSRVPLRDRVADEAAVAARVLALADDLGLGAGTTVAAYVAMALEPPTSAAISGLRTRGVRVLVPLTLPDLDLDWCDVGDERRMPLGRNAIDTAPLVLVPASGVDGVDGSRTRLGRGGGSYDRVLGRTAGLVVALVWPWEVHHGEVLPREAHDVPVARHLTPGA